MRDSAIRDRLNRIAELVAHLDKVDLLELDPIGGLVRRAGRAQIPDAFLDGYRTCRQLRGRGYPTDTSQQPQGRSGGHGTSVPEREAIAGRRDPFELDLRQADSHLSMVLFSLEWLAKFTVRYTVPAADAAAALHDDCASCARLGRAVDAHRTPESIEGVPAKPLCRWCYDFVLVNGCWPPSEILELHHDGRRISEQLVRAALGRRP